MNQLIQDSADALEWASNRIDELEAENARLRTTLDKLSRLGNEPHVGNSIGNQIAKDALDNNPFATAVIHQDANLPPIPPKYRPERYPVAQPDTPCEVPLTIDENGKSWLLPKDWPSLNARRYELIDKRIEGPLSPEEQVEYDRLDSLAEVLLDEVTPSLDTRDLDSLLNKYK